MCRIHSGCRWGSLVSLRVQQAAAARHEKEDLGSVVRKEESVRYFGIKSCQLDRNVRLCTAQPGSLAYVRSTKMLHVKGRRGVRDGFIGREELPAPTQAGGGQCDAMSRQSHALIVPGICMSMGLRMLCDDVKPIHSLGTKSKVSLPCAMKPKPNPSTVLAHESAHA